MGIKDKLKAALDYIRGNKILDAAAKSILQEIPIVGGFLVTLYDNSAEDDSSKIEKIIHVLDNLQKFNEQQFEELKNAIESNKENLLQNSESLSLLSETTTKIVNKLDEIHGLMSHLKVQQNTGLQQIRQDIQSSENNLKEFMKLNLSTIQYDVTMPSDCLNFYLKLQGFLKKQDEIFFKQLRLAKEILSQFNDDEIIRALDGKIGKDYALSGLYKKFNQEQLEKFQLVREITEHMKEFNSYAKDLLWNNKQFENDLVDLKDLFEHYCCWQAKYELLKDNEETGIIYTGADQKKPFPQVIDKKIADKIAQLKKETYLDSH